MKYLLFLSFLFLLGCEGSKYALVNITCYNYEGEVTLKRMHVHGPFAMIDDTSMGHKSQKCVVERAE